MVSQRTVVIVAVSALLAAAITGGGVYWVMHRWASATADEQSTTIASLRRQLSEAKATPAPTRTPVASTTPTATPVSDATAVTLQTKAFTAKLGTSSEDSVGTLFTAAYLKTFQTQYQSSVAALLGVQDTPDQGYTYGTPSVKGTAADITVGFKYSGSGTTTYKFSLQKTGTTWLINSITKQ